MHGHRIDYNDLELVAVPDSVFRRLFIGLLWQLNRVFRDLDRNMDEGDASALVRKVVPPGGAPSTSRVNHGRLIFYTDPAYVLGDELWIGIQGGNNVRRLTRVLTGELAIRNVTTTPTTQVATDDLVKFDSTAGVLTHTLLPLASAQKKPHRFKRFAGANSVTIAADGAELIDGVASLALATLYDGLTLYPDPAGWQASYE